MEDMDGFVFDAACQPVQVYTVVDFGGASRTVGSSVYDFAEVSKRIEVDGTSYMVGVYISDISDTSDDKYFWYSDNYSLDGSFCRYPIVAVRARAELDGTSYALEFDGYEASGRTPITDVEGPWDLRNGDRPTLVVESVTLDLSVAPTCR